MSTIYSNHNLYMIPCSSKVIEKHQLHGIFYSENNKHKIYLINWMGCTYRVYCGTEKCKGYGLKNEQKCQYLCNIVIFNLCKETLINTVTSSGHKYSYIDNNCAYVDDRGNRIK